MLGSFRKKRAQERAASRKGVAIFTPELAALLARGKRVLYTQQGIRFNVLRVHKGGMGIVFIAIEPRLGMFAIKTFQDKFLWNEELISRFVKEAEIWVNLRKHQNIVQAYWVEEIEGKPHIFLEYIDGGDLRRLIKGGFDDIPRAIDLAIQVCSGLDYAHNMLGIVHRDLKPENVLITGDGVAKVTDFGLASIATEVVSGGTARYMCPEQFVALPRVDTRCDIYSFGVMLYEMLTGTPPFSPTRGRSEQEAIRELELKHLQELPKDPRDLNPSIPAELAMVVMRCLEEKPGRRYGSFGQLKEALAVLYLQAFGRKYRDPAAQTLSEVDWYLDGVSCFALGRYQEGIDSLDKALARDAEQYWVLSIKGAGLFQLGKYEQAIACCNQALSIEPTDIQALENKGLSLHYVGKDEQAIVCFNEALKIDRRAYNIWHKKGLVLSDVGKDEQAIACYDKALKINRRDYRVWNGKGCSLHALKKYEEAIDCLDEALKINARAYQTWHNKALSLLLLAREEEAIACCDRALAINKKDDSAWCYKGGALTALERHREAIDCLDEALKINARNAAAWTSKGISLEGLRRYREAVGCYDRALDIDPSNEGIRESRRLCLAALHGPA